MIGESRQHRLRRRLGEFLSRGAAEVAPDRVRGLALTELGVVDLGFTSQRTPRPLFESLLRRYGAHVVPNCEVEEGIPDLVMDPIRADGQTVNVIRRAGFYRLKGDDRFCLLLVGCPLTGAQVMGTAAAVSLAMPAVAGCAGPEVVATALEHVPAAILVSLSALQAPVSLSA